MRFGMRSGFVLGTALALACTGPAFGADFLISGKIHIIKEAKLLKAVSKGAFTLPAPAGTSDPTVGGGSLDVFDTAGPGTFTSALPSAGWKGLGNPAGSKGYKYKGAGSGGDPCKVIIVKEKVIKFVCKDDQALNPPLSEDPGQSGIVLSLGTDRYCAAFGGTQIKNVAGLLKRKDAGAPGACPTPGGGGSTTTTIPSGSCCNGDTFASFSTITAPGDCGDIVAVNGMNFDELDCSGLFTGGGGNAVPLPFGIPDLGEAVTAITSCVGQAGTLGATTSTQTGSNLNCTSAGCFFGAPLAIPNPTSTPISLCVLNAISANAMGTVDCGTGATTAALPLSSILVLTGDSLAGPAGIQPCPLCSAGTCLGGPNNGMSCTAGTTAINASYPTSHDCPPDPMLGIGSIPINFALTTGTVTWTATTATNDDGTFFNQNRVFSGFCRDSDGTTSFETPPHQCWENGMAVGAACAGVFETCEQTTAGAFGPGGGNVNTITAIGNAMALTGGGPVPATLVSVFTIPFTTDAAVNASGDLPGPGAVAIPGNAETCAAANPCPD